VEVSAERAYRTACPAGIAWAIARVAGRWTLCSAVCVVDALQAIAWTSTGNRVFSVGTLGSLLPDCRRDTSVCSPFAPPIRLGVSLWLRVRWFLELQEFPRICPARHLARYGSQVLLGPWSRRALAIFGGDNSAPVCVLLSGVAIGWSPRERILGLLTRQRRRWAWRFGMAGMSLGAMMAAVSADAGSGAFADSSAAWGLMIAANVGWSVSRLADARPGSMKDRGRPFTFGVTYFLRDHSPVRRLVRRRRGACWRGLMFFLCGRAVRVGIFWRKRKQVQHV